MSALLNYNGCKDLNEIPLKVVLQSFETDHFILIFILWIDESKVHLFNHASKMHLVLVGCSIVPY